MDNYNYRSSPSYTEKYYTIPDDIAKYGILVVSNNNGAVENITLDLPKAKEMKKECTQTDYFDRTQHKEIYFSAVADELLDEKNKAWGLISARMGRKAYVSNVLRTCIFSKKNDAPDKVTLNIASEGSLTWDEAVLSFQKAKRKVLSLREEIKKDQIILGQMYKGRENLEKKRLDLKGLFEEKARKVVEAGNLETKLRNNEEQTIENEEQIKYIKKHSSFIKKIFILFHWGKLGKLVAEKEDNIEMLILEHGSIKQNLDEKEKEIEETEKKIEIQQEDVLETEKKVFELERTVYGENNSLKEKYKDNLADREFYTKIKESEKSQNSCPWTFEEYDKAREELFYAALQVRKAFILESPYIKRNLFVYEAYNNGRYTLEEKKEMFPHLFNALSIVIPVLSSTFAAVGRFLKHAGNESLGMLVVSISCASEMH